MAPCAGCHANIATACARSGMATSLALPGGAGSVDDRLAGKRFTDRKTAITSETEWTPASAGGIVIVYTTGGAMVARVRKWGNSLGVRIPKAFAEEIHIDVDGEVDLEVKNGQLVIRPVRPAIYTLAALVAGITRGNVHDEVAVGGPIGKELL